MKRVVPPELAKVKNWLLSKQKFDDYNFMLAVQSKMENEVKIDFATSSRLKTILTEYQFAIKLEELKKRMF